MYVILFLDDSFVYPQHTFWLRNKEISFWSHTLMWRPGPEVIKLFSCSTQLSTKFILLINVKMPTIFGILTFISRLNTSSESLKARNIYILQHFCFWVEILCSVKLSMKKGARLMLILARVSDPWPLGSLVVKKIESTKHFYFHLKSLNFWQKNSVLKIYGRRFSGLFLNSGFWGWLSLESQPQNAELGKL